MATAFPKAGTLVIGSRLQEERQEPVVRQDGILSSRPCRITAVGLLSLHAVLLGWGAWRHSPTYDEVGHLPAGVSHWRFRRFDLYRVNPPLVRLVASLPVVAAGTDFNWGFFYCGTQGRAEFGIGRSFLESAGESSFWLMTLARWACIPFSLLGGYFCLRWASELYGSNAGITALALWCFSPNILAHGQLITPDAAAAALGVAAAYAFWRWLRTPSWNQTLCAGIVLGMAELTKTTWIVLFGILPLLWVAWRWPSGNTTDAEPKAEAGWRGQACQMAAILLLACLVINVGYCFEGSFQKLGEYGFVSETLAGPRYDPLSVDEPRNRFRSTSLAAIPVPLPKNYVMGIDLQKQGFESKQLSYLRGEWRQGGWWYYYLYALAIKVPLGTWILLFLAVLVGLFRRRYAAGWRDELVLLAPLLVVLTLVSSQTGINNHLRYVLPIFPFAFIWMSKVAQAVDFKHWRITTLAGVALLWSVTSSLWIYPHSLSYFNELVGGPTGGDAHLGGVTVDSNVDWGQDLLYLKRWLDKHPEARPLHLAFSAAYDASVVGIQYKLPPNQPQPGWHALSVNSIRSHTQEYAYFLRFDPVDMAGYSIRIYHVTLDEANRVRRELGLPQLQSRAGVLCVGDQVPGVVAGEGEVGHPAVRAVDQR